MNVFEQYRVDLFFEHAWGRDENGRGMALVAEMSDEWGVDSEPDGKNVWFVLR